MVSPAALVAAVQSHLDGGIDSGMQGKTVTPDLVFKAAMEGDRLARSVIEEAIKPLGLALAVLMAAVHPGFLVLGGECGERIKFLAGLLETSIRSRILPEIASSVLIREGKSSNTMALIGAGLMAFDQAMLRECGAISWQNTGREGELWTGVS
jgi:predicted NBD/HSP70 family sugar kinase